MIYLDNSATTFPKPLAVRREMQRAMTEFGANPGRSGYAMCLRTTQALYEVRKEAASFLELPDPSASCFSPVVPRLSTWSSREI